MRKHSGVFILGIYRFITSCNSSRGYRNGPVCVSVCVRVLALSTVSMVTKFSTGIDLDDILDKFDGQGHQVKNAISMIF